MFRAVLLETHHGRSVMALGLVICMGVICIHGQLFNVQTDCECCQELGLEMWSGVGQQLCWYLVGDDPIIHKSVRSLCKGYLCDLYCTCQFLSLGLSKEFHLHFQTLSSVTGHVCSLAQNLAPQRWNQTNLCLVTGSYPSHRA